MANTAMKVCVQVFVWMYAFASLGYIRKNEVDVSYDDVIVNF